MKFGFCLFWQLILYKTNRFDIFQVNLQNTTYAKKWSATKPLLFGKNFNSPTFEICLVSQQQEQLSQHAFKSA